MTTPKLRVWFDPRDRSLCIHFVGRMTTVRQRPVDAIRGLENTEQDDVEVVAGPTRPSVEALLLKWEDRAKHFEAVSPRDANRIRQCIDELRALVPVSEGPSDG